MDVETNASGVYTLTVPERGPKFLIESDTLGEYRKVSPGGALSSLIDYILVLDPSDSSRLLHCYSTSLKSRYYSQSIPFSHITINQALLLVARRRIN